jgi:hypothetical protein
MTWDDDEFERGYDIGKQEGLRSSTFNFFIWVYRVSD